MWGGYVSYTLASEYECEVTGIDIYKDSNWKLLQHEKLNFMEVNICEDNKLLGEKFDLIISYVAWEHIKKPFEALLQTKKLLKHDGKFYLYAWLYRSPMASHLYRHIHFPYPHLLFDDELVKKYALRLGVKQSWIDSFFDCNKLTYAEYKEYFNLLGYKVTDEYLKFRPLDVDFYKRFEEKLGLYPIYDLTLDYFAVILEHNSTIKNIVPYGVGNILIDEGNKAVGKEIIVKISVVDKNVECAWDVICNGEKVKYIKWRRETTVVYIPERDGKYIFKCYIRRKGCDGRVTRKSKEIEVL